MVMLYSLAIFYTFLVVVKGKTNQRNNCKAGGGEKVRKNWILEQRDGLNYSSLNPLTSSVDSNGSSTWF